jgi:CubicO group peptidase (beta-lactamase class C family)
VHNLSAGQYQARFNELVAQGYAPVLISAAGPADTATFVALFEQGISIPWFARHNLRWGPDSDPDSLVHENARAMGEGYIPCSLAVYGTADDRRFAGTWFKNLADPANPAHVTTSPAPWSWWFADRDTHQLIFNAEVEGGMRPDWISAAPDEWQLSVFRDDQIGEWWARHGISGDDYQTEFNARVSVGAMPLVVQAGGTGRATRYSSIFAHSETPAPRQFTSTGSLDRRLTGLDEIIRQFMAAHAVRAGGVAVLRGDEVLVRRGYTWAEPGYPITQPASRFRIASLAKLITAAAIDRLVRNGLLAWNTAAYPRIDQLIHHTSGMNHAQVTQNGVTRNFEPSDELRTIAARLGRTTMPSRDEVIRYMHGEKPDFPPGTQEKYSNFGYVLLTSIIEAASRRSYLRFIQDEILTPLGLSEVRIAATAAGRALPGEVRYDHPGSGLSVLQPSTNAWAPNAYGGVFALENSEGSGGLISTAETIARLISHYAVWGVGGRQPGSRRYGILDGTMAGAESRHDGVDFAYLFNRRVTLDEQNAFTDAIGAFLTASI